MKYSSLFEQYKSINNLNNATIKGTYAEMIFNIECLLHNWDIAKPTLTSRPYDYVIKYKHGQWQTVQVKTVRKVQRNSHSYKVDILRYSKKGKTQYNDGDFDLLAAVRISDGAIWLIPWETVAHIKHHISLTGNKYLEYRIN